MIRSIWWSRKRLNMAGIPYRPPREKKIRRGRGVVRTHVPPHTRLPFNLFSPLSLSFSFPSEKCVRKKFVCVYKKFIRFAVDHVHVHVRSFCSNRDKWITHNNQTTHFDLPKKKKKNHIVRISHSLSLSHSLS